MAATPKWPGVSPARRNSRQFSCGHWGLLADEHSKCLSCRAYQRVLCLKSLPCEVCELWDSHLWDLFHSKLQALMDKKAPTWDTSTLSHVNLVLQDGGVLSPSSSDNEASPHPTPAPRRLKSVAIKPPAKHATVDKAGDTGGEGLSPAVQEDLTVKEGVKSSQTPPPRNSHGQILLFLPREIVTTP